MPISSDSGKWLIDRAVLRLTKQAPHLLETHKVLDIAVGEGTYSNRYSRSFLTRKKFRWTGIEIWEPYVKEYSLKAKYDDFFLTDARTFFDTNTERFDICFIGDVLEHMTGPEAAKLVAQAITNCGVVIISIPIGKWPQDAVGGNPYETHVKDDWTHEDVLGLVGDNLCFWGLDKEIGIYIASQLPIHFLFQPQVGVYSICKNELPFIERMYRSIEEADSIEICDTGSTDGTYDKLKELSDKRLGGFGLHKITVSPWRFDDARNAALMLLPEEIDVCISIDADELMEPGWKDILQAEVLKDLQTQGKPCDRYNHRFSTIWNWKELENGATSVPGTSVHWHERIHNRRGFLWKLPVHEVLVKGDGTSENVRWLENIKMLQKPDLTKSRSYYLPMMEQAIKEDKKRWKLRSFYAGDFIGLGKFDEGIAQLTEALTLPDADIGFLHTQLSRAYQAKGDLPLAIKEMTSAACLSSHLREFKVYVARLYLANNQPVQARTWLTMAKDITFTPTGYEFDQSCWGEQLDEFERAVADMEAKQNG